MPQNTPMKRQFTTIDGRTVMSNLPQHWGGNDWAITGVDNPLPVGNYVQTDSGVWIPQKGSVDGAADVRLTGSIGQQAFQYQRTDSFAPGEEYTVLDTITPVIIDDIDWFPRHEIHALLQINIYGIGVNFIDDLGTGVYSWINPDTVKKGVGLYWDIITYDTTVTPAPVFRFRLRKPLYCPKGIYIKLRNSDAEKTFRNSIDVRGRKLL